MLKTIHMSNNKLQMRIDKGKTKLEKENAKNFIKFEDWFSKLGSSKRKSVINFDLYNFHS